MTTYDDQVEIERLLQHIVDRQYEAEEQRDNYKSWHSGEQNKWHWPEVFVGFVAFPAISLVLWILVHFLMAIKL